MAIARALKRRIAKGEFRNFAIDASQMGKWKLGTITHMADPSFRRDRFDILSALHTDNPRCPDRTQQ